MNCHFHSRRPAIVYHLDPPKMAFRPRDGINPRRDALWAAVSDKNQAEVARILGPLPPPLEPAEWEAFDNADAAAALALRSHMYPKYDDVNFVAPDGGKAGKSLMNHAAWVGDADIFSLLMMHGGDVGGEAWCRNKGSSAFQQACRFNRPLIAEACLTMGRVDPNVLGDDGNAPLHVAAKQGFVPLTKVLLANGARTDVTNKSGKCPMDLATDDDVKRLLSGSAHTESAAPAAVAKAPAAAPAPPSPAMAARSFESNNTPSHHKLVPPRSDASAGVTASRLNAPWATETVSHPSEHPTPSGGRRGGKAPGPSTPASTRPW